MGACRCPMFIVVFFFLAGLAFGQATTDGEKSKISLFVPAGVPLRLYLTRRIPKRAGAPVEAKLMEAAFAFDKGVIPAGSVAQGSVEPGCPHHQETARTRDSERRFHS